MVGDIKTSVAQEVEVTRTFTINAKALQPFEIGARLDMLMAYPRRSDEKIIELADALCADNVQITVEAHPRETKAIHDEYAYRQRKNRTSLAGRKGRYEYAMFATQIASQFILEPNTWQLPTLPSGVERSVNQIARWLTPQHLGEDDDRYEDRLRSKIRSRWLPWRSVAHLAAARLVIERGRKAIGLPMFDLQDLLVHRSWVEIANINAQIMRESEFLPWDATNLIDIVWSE